MGLSESRRADWERAHYETLSTENLQKLVDLQVEHASLGEQRRKLHGAIFEAKQTLLAAQRDYRDVLAERLRVQDEMGPLLPPSPKAVSQTTRADVLADVFAARKSPQKDPPLDPAPAEAEPAELSKS